VVQVERVGIQFLKFHHCFDLLEPEDELAAAEKRVRAGWVVPQKFLVAAWRYRHFRIVEELLDKLKEANFEDLSG